MSTRAWDDTRPPELDLIKDCVHCGFCLPTCPSYAVFEDEMDSPRGRIVLMRIGHEEGSEVSPEMTTHLDRCLGCMACVTACPSGVQYDRLIERARPQIERHGAALAPREGAAQGHLRALHPPRPAARARCRSWRPAAAAAEAVRRTSRPRSRRGPRSGGCPRSPPPSASAAAGSRSCRAASSACSSATSTPPPCACWPPRAGRCTRRARRAAAARSSCTPASRTRRASSRAATIDAYEGFDHVVVNVAGCGSAMKEYGYLFEGDERAEAFSAKVLDVHELLAAHEPRAERKPLAAARSPTTTPATSPTPSRCARSRASCCAASPSSELLEPAEWELCCGSAGIYNLVQPEAAAKLGRAQGREPRGHRRRGDRRRQPGLRDPDRRAHGDAPSRSTTR